jgi:DNA-binding PadR family transcriptional regulator
VGEWGGVSVGALYRELRGMEREGLVEAERTEKVGNRPERTVYAITAEGRLELTMLREQAIRPQQSGPDPLGVALLFAADGLDRADLRRTLRARRDMLAITAAEITADRERLIAEGYLDVLAAAVMRRAIVHVEAEIRWHDELDATLAKTGGGEATVGSLRGGSFEAATPRDREDAGPAGAEKNGAEKNGAERKAPKSR